MPARHRLCKMTRVGSKPLSLWALRYLAFDWTGDLSDAAFGPRSIRGAEHCTVSTCSSASGSPGEECVRCRKGRSPGLSGFVCGHNCYGARAYSTKRREMLDSDSGASSASASAMASDTVVPAKFRGHPLDSRTLKQGRWRLHSPPPMKWMLPPRKTRLGQVPIALNFPRSHADLHLLGLDNLPTMSHRNVQNPSPQRGNIFSLQLVWHRQIGHGTGRIDLKATTRASGAIDSHPIDPSPSTLLRRLQGRGCLNRVALEADDGRAQAALKLATTTRPKIQPSTG
ncbi:hypothetical protein NM208_g12880 [Fusarium decemcellulare]|uniref:Uncharacterized protein n=1 Tax=Fusarium decemcellulare TaxID=57161 RepID=A0ACC1RMK9_9HYPO|nr:hypothetical protein NM208_g12880 [Fusarium decemcellulare]